MDLPLGNIPLYQAFCEAPDCYGGLLSKGAAMVAWMKANNRENPLYARFDRVVAILKKYNVLLSLGNGLRAGSIGDSSGRDMM